MAYYTDFKHKDTGHGWQKVGNRWFWFNDLGWWGPFRKPFHPQDLPQRPKLSPDTAKRIEVFRKLPSPVKEQR